MALSWIARERVPPGPPPAWFWVGALGLVFASFGVLFFLVLRLDVTGPLPAEADTLAEGPALLRVLYPAMGLFATRLTSAVAAALAVGLVAVVGRRLWHAPLVGLLAAALVAADPAFHTHGHTATPMAPVAFLALAGLAGFLQTRSFLQWTGAVALLLGAFLEPRLALWAPPLFALLLLRGHIYAAPKHLGLAALQGLALPLLGAVLGLLATGGQRAGLPACLDAGAWEGLVLAFTTGLGGTRYAVHNPAVWFGGALALLYLAVVGLAAALGGFRLQRLPGRIQIRLPAPLGRSQGRALWLLALALFVPIPFLWLPLFALALAAGLHELGEDARGFGILLSVLVLGFALVYTMRLWGLVTGQADPAEAARLLEVVPWAQVHACGA